MNKTRITLAVLLMTGSLSGVCAQDAPLFPFVLPWDDASPTVVDVGALNPVPAGVNGFITTRNGRFVDQKGRRVRFLGVNVVANAAFPAKTDAEKVAARMHKFGINIVRFHHMDASWANPPIFDSAFKDTQHLSADQLDRLDYFVSQLKKNGIYANFNLHVSRSYTPEDGLPETELLAGNSKLVTYFEPRMIALQKEYARQLLTHKNPYTGLKYVEDPAVAVVELNNEDTLLGDAWLGSLYSLPPHYAAELQKQWNAWLKKKYRDTSGLKRAWSSEDKPLGPNLLQNSGFTRGAEHWTLELNQAPASGKMELSDDFVLPPNVGGNVLRVRVDQISGQNWHIQFHQAGLDLTEGEPYTVLFRARADKPRNLPLYASLDKEDWHQVGLNSEVALTTEWKTYALAFTAVRTEKNHSRLTFVMGNATGHVDFAGLELRPGVETPFPDNASLEAASVPIGRPSANPAGRDWIAFLMDTEKNYVAAMSDFIKKELGAKANVTCSQANFGGLAGLIRESRTDFVDVHAYWEHPEFPGKPWDMANWRIGNSSMVRRSDGGTLPGLAQYRVAGKPLTVSEYNHPAPNDYQAETVPLLAAFAALQDWDGIYLFDYNSDRSAWNADKIKSFFSVDTNPAKMALFPAAALLFLRNDMALANRELRLTLPEGDAPRLQAKAGTDINGVWETAGIERREALLQRFSVRVVKGSRAEKPPLPSSAPKNEPDTGSKPETKGPFSWPSSSSDKPVMTADSPSSKVIVGMAGGQSVSLEGWLAQVAESPRNFAVLTLSAIDGKPTERSQKLLLTAVGYVGNTGMEWDANRTSVGEKWGAGPTVAEGIRASITIRTQATSAAVYALDGTGKRQGKVDSTLSDGSLTFAIGPTHKTLWYEIETGTAALR